jgi:hypothetical protein
MQRHHTGSGRARVIPHDWSAHHRPVLDTTHTVTVTIRPPGGTLGTFDPVLGTRPVTPYPVYYTGLARVQLMVRAQDQIRNAGEQQVSTIGYQVTLDSEVTGIEIGYLVRVTELDDNGDVSLIGRDLTVEAIERGSLYWERRLLCSDDLEVQET